MDAIQQKYQRYLEKKTQHEKETFLYESKLAEAKSHINRSLAELDEDALTQLGIHITVDVERLNDKTYQMELMHTLTNAKQKLDSLAHQLLDEVK